MNLSAFSLINIESLLDCLPPDQYLCTGLDMYLNFEPDLTTAMALAHSRIRRVFYVNEDGEMGSLGTHYRVHCMRELKHRFRVFKIVNK